MFCSSNLSNAKRQRTLTALGLAICAIFLLLLATSASADDSSDTPDAPGSIAGTVTNESGTPLAGIDVSLYRNQSRLRGPIETDETGHYEFRVLGAGIYQLRFADPSGTYARQYYDGVKKLSEATDILIAGQDVNGIDVTMVGGARITGTVAVSTTGRSSGYAWVQLWQEADDEEYRDVDGQSLYFNPESETVPNYEFAGLDAGKYIVCVSATSYYTMPDDSSRSLDISECYDDLATWRAYRSDPPENAADADVIELGAVETVSDINFLLGKGGHRARFSGTVRDSEGNPIEYAGISLYPESAERHMAYSGVSDITGAYVVTGVAPGSYYVRFTDPSSEKLSLCLNELDGCSLPAYEDTESMVPLELAPDEVRTGMDAVLNTPAQINGKITINGRQAPESMRVDVNARNVELSENHIPQGQDYYNKATGIYTMTNLASGSYHLWATGRIDGEYFSNMLTDEMGEPMTVTVQHGERIVDVDIDLEPEAYEGILHGVIDNGIDPLPDLRVAIYESSYYHSRMLIYTDTNASGAYRLEGLGTGSYHARVSDPSGTYATVYSASAENPYVTQGHYVTPGQQTISFSLSLTRAGRIEGQIVPSFDDPDSEYQVTSHFVTLWESGACGIFAMPEQLDCLLALPTYYRRFSTAPSGVLSPDGRYTVAGLYPGIYVVELRQRSSPSESWHSARFFPQGNEPYDARLLVVSGGGTVDNIDFNLNMAPRQFLPLAEQR